MSRSRRDQRSHRRKVGRTGQGMKEHTKRMKRRARREKAQMQARIDLPNPPRRRASANR